MYQVFVIIVMVGEKMKVLVVVDMQEDYIGKRAKYQFSDKENLIHNINKRIQLYLDAHHYVIYVKNKRKNDSSDFVTGLDIRTDFIFEKEKSSCFSNPQFKDFLDKNQIDEIEVCGIDGNSCVKSIALDASKNGYQVSILLENVGIMNKERFEKTLTMLKKSNIHLQDEANKKI